MSLTTKQEHVTTTYALCMISKRHKQRRFHSASPRPRALCLCLCLASPRLRTLLPCLASASTSLPWSLPLPRQNCLEPIYGLKRLRRTGAAGGIVSRNASLTPDEPGTRNQVYSAGYNCVESSNEWNLSLSTHPTHECRKAPYIMITSLHGHGRLDFDYCSTENNSSCSRNDIYTQYFNVPISVDLQALAVRKINTKQSISRVWLFLHSDTDRACQPVWKRRNCIMHRSPQQ